MSSSALLNQKHVWDFNFFSSSIFTIFLYLCLCHDETIRRDNVSEQIYQFSVHILSAPKDNGTFLSALARIYQFSAHIILLDLQLINPYKSKYIEQVKIHLSFFSCLYIYWFLWFLLIYFCLYWFLFFIYLDRTLFYRIVLRKMRHDYLGCANVADCAP